MGGLGVVVLLLGGRRLARARGRRARARARSAARQPPHRLARLLAAQRQRRAGRARDRGHDDADARLAASRRARASPQSGVGAAFTLVAFAGCLTTLTIARISDRLDRLKTVGLGHAAARALPRRHGAAARHGRVHRGDGRVRDRAVDRLRLGLPAGRRRRRARRRRPGRRHGPAPRQLGRRRADRPGGDRQRWRSSRTTPPRSRSRAPWRWPRPSASAGARAGKALHSPLDRGRLQRSSDRSDRPRVGDEALRRRSWPSTTSPSRSTRASSSRCSARRAAARRRRCA